MFGWLKKNRITGTILLNGLPPSQGHLISALLLKADGSGVPPYNGEPPAKAYEDSTELAENIHIGEVIYRDRLSVEFELEASKGIHYLGVTATLFRKKPDGEVIAQLERFCLESSRIDLPSEEADLGIFSISWPDLPFEELTMYATFKPGEPPAFY